MAEIKHLDAFEYYYSLGSARTYEQVAQKFNVKYNTVNNWGYKEKWQEEVKLRDIEQLKENRRLSLVGRRSKAKEYKTIVEACIGQYVEKLKKGKVEVKSVKDLETLIKLQCYLDDFVVNGEEKVLYDSPVGVEEQSAGATSIEDNSNKFDFTFEIVKK